MFDPLEQAREKLAGVNVSPVVRTRKVFGSPAAELRVSATTRQKVPNPMYQVDAPKMKFKKAAGRIVTSKPPSKKKQVKTIPNAPQRKAKSPKLVSAGPRVRSAAAMQSPAQHVTGPGIYGQSESAFERALNTRELRDPDGSGSYAGLREYGSGQFGSHPTFDPQDEYDS